MGSKQEEKGFLVKAEGNFEDHPYFTVGNQRGGEGVIQYTNTIRTRDGQELRQSWTVRAVHGLGLPGTLDQDVYVALLQIIDQQGGTPGDGWVEFSLYELMQLLHRSHGGRDYRQIKESLERLSGTIIQSKNAFYRAKTKSYLDDTFHLLDRVQHSETTDGSRRSERTRVKLSEYFVESYKANYLKGLDVDFYWSLNSSVAKRLYRFVDKKRHQQRRWEVDLFSLRDRIPLSPYKYPSKIKEKLAPAHEELHQKGFLEKVHYRKMPDGSHLVCYEIHDAFSRRRPAPQLDTSPETLIAVERLRAEGMRADTARDLVSRYGPERCQRYADAAPFQKNLRNRPGWLKKAVENGYELDQPPAQSYTKLHNTPGEEIRSPHGKNGGGQLPLGAAVAEGEDVTAEGTVGVVVEDAGAAAAWGRLLDRLCSETEASYAANWFDGMVATSFDSGVLYVFAPNSIARDYVEDRFGPALRELLTEEFGPAVSLRFSCSDMG
jgi:hypothetical protein